MNLIQSYLEATLYALGIVSIIILYFGVIQSNTIYSIFNKGKKPKLRVVFNGFEYRIQEKSNFFNSWSDARMPHGYRSLGPYKDKKECQKEYAALHEQWNKKVAKFKVIESYVDTPLYKNMKGDDDA